MEAIGSSQSCKQIDAQALAVAVFKDEKADEGLLKTSGRGRRRID